MELQSQQETAASLDLKAGHVEQHNADRKVEVAQAEHPSSPNQQVAQAEQPCSPKQEVAQAEQHTACSSEPCLAPEQAQPSSSSSTRTPGELPKAVHAKAASSACSKKFFLCVCVW